MFDLAHEAKALTNELFYRDGPTPRGIEIGPDVTLVTEIIERGMREAMAHAGEWQPINSAPKDGTFIWLSDGHAIRIGYWYVVTVDPSKEHWADFAKAEGTGPHDLAFVPTLWIPLPKPPLSS